MVQDSVAFPPGAAACCSSWSRCTGPASAAGPAGPSSAASGCPVWRPSPEESHWSAGNLKFTSDKNTTEKCSSVVTECICITLYGHTDQCHRHIDVTLCTVLLSIDIT